MSANGAKMKGQFSYNITLLGENESYLGTRFNNIIN